MRTRTAWAALCAAALLSGCSPDAESEPLPPAPSVTPTTAALPLPPEATQATPQGAVAFARYYLTVIGSAFATADPTMLEALSAPGCGGCDALIASVKELRDQGRRRIGGDYLVTSVAAPPVSEGEVIVEISYVRSAGEVVDAAGKVRASAPPVPQTNAQIRLVRKREAWVVQGYRVVR